MTKDELIARREAILRIATHRGVRRMRVFGSVARGESTAASDIDFIVEFEPGRSLLDHGGLVMDLEELLGCKVDVISEKAVRERFRRQIEAEAIPI